MELADITAAMAGCPLFYGIEALAIEDMARSATIERVDVGGFVLRKGDNGDALFIIMSGKLAAIAAIDDKLLLLSRIYPPDAVGEIAAMDGHARTVDVIAETPSTLVRIGREALVAAIRRYPDFAERMILLLCNRVRSTSEAVEDGLRDVRSRLARRLLAMSNAKGLIEPVTQQTIAEMVGTHRIVVNRHLQQFRRDGLIIINRGRMRILDRRGLEQAAHT